MDTDGHGSIIRFLDVRKCHLIREPTEAGHFSVQSKLHRSEMIWTLAIDVVKASDFVRAARQDFCNLLAF